MMQKKLLFVMLLCCTSIMSYTFGYNLYDVVGGNINLLSSMDNIDVMTIGKKKINLKYTYTNKNNKSILRTRMINTDNILPIVGSGFSGMNLTGNTLARSMALSSIMKNMKYGNIIHINYISSTSSANETYGYIRQVNTQSGSNGYKYYTVSQGIQSGVLQQEKWSEDKSILHTVDSDKNPIQDITVLSQKIEDYVKGISLSNTTIDMKKFTEKWYESRNKEDRDYKIFSNEFIEIMSGFVKNPGYGENRLYRDATWMSGIVDEAQWNTLGTYTQTKGITLYNSSLRLIPTMKPSFDSRVGFPFDNIQQSSLPVGTPIRIIHQTKNGQWYLVQTPIIGGWILADNVAFVNEDDIKNTQSLSLGAVIDDNYIIKKNNNVLGTLRLGTILPTVHNNLLYPTKDNDGFVKFIEVNYTTTSFSSIPLQWNEKNLQAVIQQLVGNAYGRGGMVENRDCSAMIRDILLPFGILLPRNSGDQKEYGNNKVNIKSLDKNKKIEKIIKDGIPFRTLLWLPGHIMLYIGQKDGQPIVIHDIRSLRTTDYFDAGRRYILGQIVISTTSPGIELPNMDLPKGDLINRIETMTIVQ